MLAQELLTLGVAAIKADPEAPWTPANEPGRLALVQPPPGTAQARSPGRVPLWPYLDGLAALWRRSKRPPKFGSRGQSGRTGDVAGESACSQQPKWW